MLHKIRRKFIKRQKSGPAETADRFFSVQKPVLRKCIYFAKGIGSIISFYHDFMQADFY